MFLATRSQVVSLLQSRYTISKIQKHLEKEEFSSARTRCACYLKSTRRLGSVADYQIMKPPRKLTEWHYRFIDDCMASDDELTTMKLHTMLIAKFPTLNVSMSAVKRVHMELGWMVKKTRCGALVSETDQEK